MAKAYTLADLARLSRCLFPGDFLRELVEMGLSRADALDLSRMLRPGGKEGRTRNILELYQECLASTDSTYADAIENYCQWWLRKHTPAKPIQDSSDKCPDCDTELICPPGGGVRCPKPGCGYWFCF